MTTAGLYETSGDWLYDVGLPGKSGIGGGIVTVAPARAGSGRSRRRWTPQATASGDSSSRATLAEPRPRSLRLGAAAVEPAHRIPLQSTSKDLSVNLHTDLPTRTQIDRLLESRHSASVSIYLSTSPISNGDAERIELRTSPPKGSASSSPPASTAPTSRRSTRPLPSWRRRHVLALPGKEPGDLRHTGIAHDFPAPEPARQPGGGLRPLSRQAAPSGGDLPSDRIRPRPRPGLRAPPRGDARSRARRDRRPELPRDVAGAAGKSSIRIEHRAAGPGRAGTAPASVLAAGRSGAPAAPERRRCAADSPPRPSLWTACSGR